MKRPNVSLWKNVMKVWNMEVLSQFKITKLFIDHFSWLLEWHPRNLENIVSKYTFTTIIVEDEMCIENFKWILHKSIKSTKRWRSFEEFSIVAVLLNPGQIKIFKIKQQKTSKSLYYTRLYWWLLKITSI